VDLDLRRWEYLVGTNKPYPITHPSHLHIFEMVQLLQRGPKDDETILEVNVDYS
jgi:hypothetical protein